MVKGKSTHHSMLAIRPEPVPLPTPNAELGCNVHPAGGACTPRFTEEWQLGACAPAMRILRSRLCRGASMLAAHTVHRYTIATIRLEKLSASATANRTRTLQESHRRMLRLRFHIRSPSILCPAFQDACLHLSICVTTDRCSEGGFIGLCWCALTPRIRVAPRTAHRAGSA